jgi:drug/metabolite transporter (DMT)-like permease
VSFYTFLFAAMGSLLLSGLLQAPQVLLDPRAITGGLCIGIFCCLLPYIFYTEGLNHTEAGKAAILATAEPFVASLLGIILFHEVLTPFKLLGMAAILLAIILLNYKPNT